MEMNTRIRLNGIVGMIEYWIEYMEGVEKQGYSDVYRSTHDRDCVLTDGDLHADTILSMWNPLKSVLKMRKGELGGLAIQKSLPFLNVLLDGDVLERVLPDTKEVRSLERLCRMACDRCNVMILPEGHRDLNSRRGLECKDRMDLFLAECFEGGRYSDAWNGDEDLRAWIVREHLEVFFEGGMIEKDLILSLDSCKMSELFDNEVRILERRMHSMEGE